MIIKYDNSIEYFNNKVKNLKCRKDTSAYIINVLDSYKSKTYEFSNKSLTLEFAEAKFQMSYSRFNELADYILFMETTFPGALNGASRKYYWALAQSSYLRCWSFVREWKLFEELADTFPEIIKQLSNINHF